MDVKDDIHDQSNTNGDIWQGDSLQLGIDLSKEDGAASKQVNELGFALNQDGVITKWRWRAPEGVATGLLESASANITRDETTHSTHYQITLPFEALHEEGYSFQPDKPIGIAILVNENDGEGRSGFMEFNGGIGTSKDARLFGNLYLLTGDYVTLLEQSAEARVHTAEQKKDVTSIDTATNFVTLLPGGTLKSSLLVRLAALTSGSNPNPGEPNPQPGSSSGSTPSAGGGSTTGGKNEATPAASGATIQLQPKLDKTAALATAEITNQMIEDVLNRITPEQDGKKKLIVNIESVNGAEGYALTLPTIFLQESPSTHWLEIRTAGGVLLVPSSLLTNSQGTIGEHVTFVLSKADRSPWNAKLKSEFGERPAISLSVLSSGNSVAWQNTITPITVSLPYQPNGTELLDLEKLAVRRIVDDGQMISIPNGKFNKTSEQMIFKTRQNGVYAITQDNRTFQDIRQLSWARHAIEVLVSKGVIRGISKAEYQPHSMIRRADFVTLLVNALELQPDQGTKVERFADVPEYVYYEKSVNTARALGIIQGAGADRFSPASPITREEAAVMIYRATQVIGMHPHPEGESGLNDYKDTHLMKAYSRDAIDSLTRSNIMEGSNGSFHPEDTMTRAETAVLLYRLYNRLP